MKIAPEIRLLDYQKRLFEQYRAACASAGLDTLELTLAACMAVVSEIMPPYSDDLVQSGGADRLEATCVSLLSLSAELLERADERGLIDRQVDRAGMN